MGLRREFSPDELERMSLLAQQALRQIIDLDPESITPAQFVEVQTAVRHLSAFLLPLTRAACHGDFGVPCEPEAQKLEAFRRAMAGRKLGIWDIWLSGVRIDTGIQKTAATVALAAALAILAGVLFAAILT